jgi:hypothetical protein
MTAYCEEHSEVMRCLGALEQGQKDVKGLLEHIDVKITTIQSSQVNGKVTAAVEKTKSNLLYWVIAIGTSGIILGLINLALREFHK